MCLRENKIVSNWSSRSDRESEFNNISSPINPTFLPRQISIDSTFKSSKQLPLTKKWPSIANSNFKHPLYTICRSQHLAVLNLNCVNKLSFVALSVCFLPLPLTKRLGLIFHWKLYSYNDFFTFADQVTYLNFTMFTRQFLMVMIFFKIPLPLLLLMMLRCLLKL